MSPVYSISMQNFSGCDFQTLSIAKKASPSAVGDSEWSAMFYLSEISSAQGKIVLKTIDQSNSQSWQQAGKIVSNGFVSVLTENKNGIAINVIDKMVGKIPTDPIVFLEPTGRQAFKLNKSITIIGLSEDEYILRVRQYCRWAGAIGVINGSSDTEK